MKKNNLDEMQEQALLKIEHNGCWLAFWGLLAALFAEGILGFGMKAMAGEWMIFMLLSVYLCADCLHKGVWDRRLKPNWKTNLLVSLIGGIVVGVFTALRVYFKFPEYPVSSIWSGVFSGVFCFFMILAALAATSAAYKKRKEELEKE